MACSVTTLGMVMAYASWFKFRIGHTPGHVACLADWTTPTVAVQPSHHANGWPLVVHVAHDHYPSAVLGAEGALRASERTTGALDDVIPGGGRRLSHAVTKRRNAAGSAMLVGRPCAALWARIRCVASCRDSATWPRYDGRPLWSIGWTNETAPGRIQVPLKALWNAWPLCRYGWFCNQ